MPGVDVVTIGSGRLTTAEVAAAAAGAKVELSGEAIQRMKGARAVVDALVAGDTPIYGLNTGLGHMRDQRVAIDLLRDYQMATLKIHWGGLGPPLPAGVVRAAMVARVAGLALGGAGASPAVAETLVAMLNAGVHPVVPLVGSVGASDLMHMAAIGMVAVGLGNAVYNGETLAGGEALARARIEPLRMEPKDALTLVSANGVSVGHGALVAEKAASTVGLLDVAAALSMEANRGNPSVTEPEVAAAKPIPGQIDAAAHIRRLLDGSDLCTAGGPKSVQDPLSFRVAPQVHGAVRELLAFTKRAVEDELASMDDNPLVVTEQNRIVSNGNFHPMLMALSFDALRPGLVHAGQLSDRRMGHHFDHLFSDPSFMEDAGMKAAGSYGGVGLARYSAAARYAELRLYAAPATLDIPPLDLGVEDHSTNAPFTVRRTEEAIALLDELIAAEILTAHYILRFAGEPTARLGRGTCAAVDAMNEGLSGLAEGVPLEQTHAELVKLLPGILAAADSAIG